jgi:hypothetical protein
MPRPHVRLLPAAIALAAVALLAVPVLAVAAPQRQHFREDIAETFPREDLEAICGFPIDQTNSGTVHGWFIETADGTFVAENVHVALDGQFINPANDRVVSFVIRQNVRSAEGADGSSEVVITGVLGKVRIPGQGVIAATLGRLTLSFPPDGGEPAVTFTGTENEAEFFGSPGDPGFLCDMLA